MYLTQKTGYRRLRGHPQQDEFDVWVGNIKEEIRPNGIPAFAPISNFHEINVRTYVIVQDKPGVYFLNIEAGKRLSAYIARTMSGLPYEKALIDRRFSSQGQTYTSTNPAKSFTLHATFQTGATVNTTTGLDQWLIERYCLYLDEAGDRYRYNIHHRPWSLQTVQISRLQTNYTLGGISLSHPPDLVHYSPGVKVIAWKRELMIQE